MTTPAYTWGALCGPLPDHQGEVMTAHGGQPDMSDADRQGALYLPGGKPAVDRGPEPGSVVG